jgi:hypothetical protein
VVIYICNIAFFDEPTAILVSRGNCSFFYKAQFAAYAGASTVLVYNVLAGMYLNANLSGTRLDY